MLLRKSEIVQKVIRVDGEYTLYICTVFATNT